MLSRHKRSSRSFVAVGRNQLEGCRQAANKGAMVENFLVCFLSFVSHKQWETRLDFGAMRNGRNQTMFPMFAICFCLLLLFVILFQMGI